MRLAALLTVVLLAVYTPVTADELSDQLAKRQADAKAEMETRRQADPQRVPFDFKADHFEALMLHVSELYGRGVWPRLRDCRDEGEGHPGFCSYRLSEAVSILVVNMIGIDRPHQVLVTWNGDPFAVGLLIDVVRGLGHVLSPTVRDGSQDAMANEVLDLVHRYKSGMPETQWTIGTTHYVIRPDPHLGSRNDIVLTATDQR